MSIFLSCLTFRSVQRIMPFIGAVSMDKYLGDGQIKQVICAGENYDGAQPCNFDRVKSLRKKYYCKIYRNRNGLHERRQAISSAKESHAGRNGA